MEKRRVGLLVMVGILLLYVVTACGSSNNKEPAGNSTTAPVSGTTPEMTALIEAAKKEGKVVYAGGTISPERRNAIIKGFSDKYGIDVEVLELSNPQFLSKMEIEIKANQVSVDVFTGPFPIYALASKDELQDLTGVLIDPALTDPGVWKKGYPWLFEGDPAKPEFKAGMFFGEQVVGQLFTNPEIINEGDLETWDDLLKPEFKGKIAGFDPREPGIGYATAGAIIHIMGEEYFQKLYNGQEVKLSRDFKQLTDWVVKGTYPILLGGNNQMVDEYMKNGLPIHMPTPKGGPDGLVGGSLAIMKSAPHPNAAKLFVNWMLTKEAQEIHETYGGGISGRTDTASRDNVIQFTIPTEEREKNTKLGKWFYDVSPEFYHQYRESVYAKIPELMDESVFPKQ